MPNTIYKHSLTTRNTASLQIKVVTQSAPGCNKLHFAKMLTGVVRVFKRHGWLWPFLDYINL